MQRSLKIFIILFVILIILIPSVFGGSLNPYDYKANIPSSDVVPVSSVAQKSLGIVFKF